MIAPLAAADAVRKELKPAVAGGKPARFAAWNLVEMVYGPLASPSKRRPKS